jgi:hypothetical protein
MSQPAMTTPPGADPTSPRPDVRDPVIVTGFTASRAHKLTPGQKDTNWVLATARAPVEHGFAHLENWRVPTKLRSDPARAPASCAPCSS